MPEEDSLVLRCRELNDVAGLVRSLLEPRMSKLAKDNLVYTFKNRLKSPGAILSKVRRKRAEAGRDAQPDPGSEKLYGPDNVTDVWGCRYVTLYQSQIPQTVKALLSNFDEFNTSAERAIRMIEFVIYTNRPPKDPLSIVNETLSVLGTCEISSGVDSKDSIRPPENRKSAYSSVHLLFAVDVDAEHPGKGATREMGIFEVQVRDIFEEGWGEIQHHLIYSEKDRSASRVDHPDDDVDPVWQQHLNALKTFVDGCSQHASIIKRTYDNIQQRSMPSLETKSATNQPSDRDAILGALDGTTHAAVATLIRAGYELVIDATTTDLVEERKTNYAAAAAKFSEALERAPELESLPVSERAGTPVGYFLGMELANCLIFAGRDEDRERALTIYESLVGAYPRDPMVRLRRGVALTSSRSDDLVTITRARDMIRESIPLIGDDPLTGPEHWISISCYVHLGFLDWRASTLSGRGKEAAAADLREAISDTRTGYDFWNGLRGPKRENETYVLYAHKALSNALYYAAQLKRMVPGDPLTTKEAIEAMIGELGRLQVPTYKEYYKTRDNIMTAWDAIGNREGARQCARENITELRKRAETRVGRSLTSTEAKNHLLEDELRNFQSAALVLADVDG